jgi:DNA-binding HxlR family transcriptional regulator
MGQDLSAAQYDCPVEGFQSLISGKYRLRILWELRSRPLRYGALRDAIASSLGANAAIAARVLSRDLKELTARAMIVRREHAAARHVEYSLTDVGKTFIPVLRSIHIWGVKHLVKQSVLDALAASKQQSQKRARKRKP